MEAPASLSVAATGMTPHEHKGKGIPNNVDLIMDEKFFEPICLKMKLLSMKIDMSPEKNIPSNKNGAISMQRDHISPAKINKYCVIKIHLSLKPF